MTDQGLRNFIDNFNNNGVPENATLLKEKVKELSEKSGQINSKASNAKRFTKSSAICYQRPSPSRPPPQACLPNYA
ncbi:hypothetical protein BpHYR1_003166 [Brachionus plicatilis]|uniref:Uncharacterized protein n=1 Tax=Brachionus plicatilis TaxID=10195 RepID=A0A3M7SKP0_BRAPC|nr:hypothetical protein BpHYR1_003166 [Brachionus plicatilis]